MLFAVIGGILLAKGEWVGGAILVMFALLAAGGNYRDEDSRGSGVEVDRSTALL